LGRGFIGLYEFWMICGWVIGVWRDGFIFIVHGFDFFCFCLFGGSLQCGNKRPVPFCNALPVNLPLFDILFVYEGWWIRG
jgi:hypothetical protein